MRVIFAMTGNPPFYCVRLPPPQARTTFSIFLHSVLAQTTKTESDNQEYLKQFAPARLLSERCTLYHKVAHPRVSLLSLMECR